MHQQDGKKTKRKPNNAKNEGAKTKRKVPQQQQQQSQPPSRANKGKQAAQVKQKVKKVQAKHQMKTQQHQNQHTNASSNHDDQISIMVGSKPNSGSIYELGNYAEDFHRIFSSSLSSSTYRDSASTLDMPLNKKRMHMLSAFNSHFNSSLKQILETHKSSSLNESLTEVARSVTEEDYFDNLKKKQKVLEQLENTLGSSYAYQDLALEKISDSLKETRADVLKSKIEEVGLIQKQKQPSSSSSSNNRSSKSVDTFLSPSVVPFTSASQQQESTQQMISSEKIALIMSYFQNDGDFSMMVKQDVQPPQLLNSEQQLQQQPQQLLPVKDTQLPQQQLQQQQPQQQQPPKLNQSFQSPNPTTPKPKKTFNVVNMNNTFSVQQLTNSMLYNKALSNSVHAPPPLTVLPNQIPPMKTHTPVAPAQQVPTAQQSFPFPQTKSLFKPSPVNQTLTSSTNKPSSEIASVIKNSIQLFFQTYQKPQQQEIDTLETTHRQLFQEQQQIPLVTLPSANDVPPLSNPKLSFKQTSNGQLPSTPVKATGIASQLQASSPAPLSGIFNGKSSFSLSPSFIQAHLQKNLSSVLQPKPVFSPANNNNLNSVLNEASVLSILQQKGLLAQNGFQQPLTPSKINGPNSLFSPQPIKPQSNRQNVASIEKQSQFNQKLDLQNKLLFQVQAHSEQQQQQFQNLRTDLTSINEIHRH